MQQPTTDERTQRIAHLNDQHRKQGGYHYSPGVQALSPSQRILLGMYVHAFNDFSQDNDPYGERDFGAIEFMEVRYFWKIDYYDLDLEGLSDDPSDDTLTKRVLTVMTADEY